MPVTDYYHIFKITFPSTWIAIIVACLVAYIAIRMKFGKNHAERYGDSVFYLIIIWKLSVVLTDFKTVMNAPISIVYFNGGFVGFCIGLAFVAYFITRDYLKGKMDRGALEVLFIGTVVTLALFQVMMVVLNNGSVLVKLITAVIFLATAIFVWQNARKKDDQLIQLALLVMAAHTFVASVQPQGIFQPAHSVTLAICLFFIVMFIRKDKIVVKERGN